MLVVKVKWLKEQAECIEEQVLEVVVAVAVAVGVVVVFAVGVVLEAEGLEVAIVAV